MDQEYSLERLKISTVDYSVQPVKNLRDVMLVPSLLYDNSLQGLWFRSGDLVSMNEALSNKFKTIITFRARDDSSHEDISESGKLQHLPLLNDLNVYDVGNNITAQWLKDSIHTIANRMKKGQFPILFHCFSGKDRTGVVAATLQTILGVPREMVVDDYNSSDGKLFPDLFETFLDAIGNLVLPFIVEDIASIQEMARTIRGPVPCDEPPGRMHRISCGYLPRNISLRFGSSNWLTDENGRLCRYQGTLKLAGDLDCPSNLTPSHPSQFDLKYLRQKGFAWKSIIPSCFGVGPSLFNEIFISRSALEEYGRVFSCLRNVLRGRDGLLRDGVDCSSSEGEIDITIQMYYYPNSDLPQGITRPDYLTICVSSKQEKLIREIEAKFGNCEVSGGSAVVDSDSGNECITPFSIEFEIQNSIPFS